MPKLEAYHHYRLKGSPKNNEHFIIPIADREVSQKMFDEYKDVTKGNGSVAIMVKFDCVEEI
jgi:hypothetical protein